MRRNFKSMSRTLSSLLACSAMLAASGSEARSAMVSSAEVRAIVGRSLGTGMIFDWTGACLSQSVATLDDSPCTDMPELLPEDVDSSAMNSDDNFNDSETAQAAPANDNASDDASPASDTDGYSDYYRFKFGLNEGKEFDVKPDATPSTDDAAADRAVNNNALTESAATEESGRGDETPSDETAKSDEAAKTEEAAKPEAKSDGDVAGDDSGKSDESADSDASKPSDETAGNDESSSSEETAKLEEAMPEDSAKVADDDATKADEAATDGGAKSDADTADNMEKYYHYRYQPLEDRYGNDANHDGDANSSDNASPEDACPADDSDGKASDGDSAESSTDNSDSSENSAASETSESAALADALLGIMNHCTDEFAARWGMSTTQVGRLLNWIY